MRSALLVAAFAILVSQTNAATRTDEAALRKDIARVIAPLIEKRWLAGAVVAVIRPDATVIAGFGTTGGGAPCTPGPATQFEIGSISKTFTGALLALGVQAGQVKLDEPLEAALPPGPALPEFQGAPVRVIDAATQHSGLPSDPPEFPTLFDPDPYAGYTVDMLRSAVSGYSLEATPGTTYGYSNIATALLGHAAAHAVRRQLQPGLGIGLMWHVYTDDGVVWHNGATGGYRSWCGFRTDLGCGAVVLTNTGSYTVDGLGMRMMQLATGQAPMAWKLPEAVEGAPLADYAGRYRLAPGYEFAVTRDGDALRVQLPRQPAFRVWPRGGDAFFYRIAPQRIEFKRDPAGRVIEAVLNGQPAARLD